MENNMESQIYTQFQLDIRIFCIARLENTLKPACTTGNVAVDMFVENVPNQSAS